MLQKYLALVKQLIEKFEYFYITKISRIENQRADALSKLVSSSLEPSNNKVIIEQVASPSISKTSIGDVDEVGDNWMTHIKEYLTKGTLPSDKRESHKFKMKSP